MFTHAIARQPGANFDHGLTTSTALGPPSYPLMLHQHQAYLQALTESGLEVILLEDEPDYPDAYFVEDTAIVTPQVAVITRPGAPSRRGEEETIVPVLRRFRPITRIEAPGTLDGGDVLMAGNHFFIGSSLRTNWEGAAQLADALKQHGHTAEVVPVEAGLHLKSSVNYLGENTLLVTEALANYPGFAGYQRIILHPDEEYAANTLRINHVLLTPSGFPRTLEQLSRLGLKVIELDVSEVHKMDGGLTCMSLRF
jgi:dimethylargininase